jgi:hypothetical protein
MLNLLIWQVKMKVGNNLKTLRILTHIFKNLNRKKRSNKMVRTCYQWMRRELSRETTTNQLLPPQKSLWICSQRSKCNCNSNKFMTILRCHRTIWLLRTLMFNKNLMSMFTITHSGPRPNLQSNWLSLSLLLMNLLLLNSKKSNL